MNYELYISEASPYSIKAQALLGYTGFHHDVKIQNGWSRYRVLKRLTGKTMVPVLRKGDWAINDSTEILRYVMNRSSRPTLPRNSDATVLAWLLEDFADEWMVRWVVSSRWRHEKDAEDVQELLGRELLGGLSLGSKFVGDKVGAFLRERLRLWGLQEENTEAFRRSEERCLLALQNLFSGGPDYLFGGYPTVTDFAFFGALGQFFRDPTGRQRVQQYPAVLAYIQRMGLYVQKKPTVKIKPEEERDLEELQPLFGEALGTYWPLLLKNVESFEGGQKSKEFEAVLLDGSKFVLLRSRYLQNRLNFWLELIDQGYQSGDHLFGKDGLRMERALVQKISDLSSLKEGRKMLKNYSHIGLH